MRVLTTFFGVSLWISLFSQETAPAFEAISTENDGKFEGFELIEPKNQQLFVLAEHWHNIRSVPQATLKLLQYLHRECNVRILAIEQGGSAAHMVNSYLRSGDTTALAQITRNTLFWGKENRAFFQDLRDFNLTLPLDDRIFVRSIDIEYKMAAAIFVINELIGPKSIPESMQSTLGVFKHLFISTREHREQFDGLAVMYYYDHDGVEQLVLHTLEQLRKRATGFQAFFEADFEQFSQIITEMDQGIVFDYTNPNTNYKFRDRLIEQKMLDLVKTNPGKGILCPIGLRHATKGSSLHNLATKSDSPLYEQVMTIRISALFNKMINAGDLKKFNYNYPKQLKVNAATLIRHNQEESALRSSKGFDFTLFINDNAMLTPFEKVYREEY